MGRVSSSESNVDVHRQLAAFSNYLKRKGLKITNQRLLVAEKIFSLQSHFTVDTLAEELKERRNEISRATIYRIVTVMVEAGLLTEHNFGQNARYFEYIPRQEHHDHIICNDCGRIDEFVHDGIEQIQLQIAEQHGYDLSEHSLNLYGSCQELRKKGTCSRRVVRENRV
ncbi:MAG: transcriptional repressor [Leptospiraceae bacterium]|nr:transcriptional repressor [Leptospiraceae bacterium]MCB1315102.1 transcriptional repressor [Leptospiraceae bacterium]MCB1319022.1 transcriptional repressor [Leptospiraceae bacterium]